MFASTYPSCSWLVLPPFALQRIMCPSNSPYRLGKNTNQPEMPSTSTSARPPSYYKTRSFQNFIYRIILDGYTQHCPKHDRPQFAPHAIAFLAILVPFRAETGLRKYQFDIQVKNVSRLCHAKPIVTVNGMYPGPTVYARDGDRVQIRVTNHVKYNISIHWHG
ncbi:unnamed protein product [Rhodiola kirilowii]